MDAITKHHYHNIAHGKAKALENGDLATVHTAIVNIDGVETLIPTVWDGEIVDVQTAIKFAVDSGIAWPTRTGPEAVAELEKFDAQIHQNMKDTTTPEEAEAILAQEEAQENRFNGGGLMTSLRPKARPAPLRPQARPPTPETVLTMDELEKIEKVVWAEANTEGVVGRNAVRGVIFNRLASDRFGDTVDEVLVANEFEPLNTYGSFDKIPISKDHLLRGMEEIVDYIQLGDDASQGSTFFQNTATTGARGTKFNGDNPISIGKHTFYSSYGNQEPVEDLWGSHNISVSYDDLIEEDMQLAQANFALGGLATATKGITTLEGKEMAAKKFQLDEKKADTNQDGELSTLERELGIASQRNVNDEILDDSSLEMYHGGMACGCGAEDGECGCGGIMMDGLMGYDTVSGNPIPVGSHAENVRDDIDAKLSTDEYVLPAHVVKWHGLKHIQMMQSEAEMGLMAMQMDGLIHHEEEEPSGEGVKDPEVSDEGNSEQEEAEEEIEASKEIPSEEVDIEVAAVEVDDQLDDSEDTEKISPKSKPLPVIVKKKKYAFAS
jgi:spore germination cell wall hydrolase CwlJ-like protein